MRRALKLDTVLDELARFAPDAQPPSIYVGSTTIDTACRDFAPRTISDLGARQPLASIWIGNRTRIAAHHDLPDNLACVVGRASALHAVSARGTRQPLHRPAGFHARRSAHQPGRFRAARTSRVSRDSPRRSSARTWRSSGPGDAIFIPSMWWHHIESLDAFNVLVNYWWRQSPAYMDSPIGALMLALMTVRDLPPAQRAAWENMFRHYVFEADEAHRGAHPRERAPLARQARCERHARDARHHPGAPE